jgi:hypothetical protein
MKQTTTSGRIKYVAGNAFGLETLLPCLPKCVSLSQSRTSVWGRKFRVQEGISNKGTISQQWKTEQVSGVVSMYTCILKVADSGFPCICLVLPGELCVN